MLKGKAAVVTGASSGIGKVLALRLASEGVTVVLGARRKEELDRIVHEVKEQGGEGRAVRCDVTVTAEAEHLIGTCLDAFGKIDILINNAGRGHFASVEDTTDEVIERMFAVNTFALWYTTRPALREMKRQGSGHVINVASMAGKVGYPFNSAYVAAKHACVGFTHGLRNELVETGIHASVVCPAGVLTDWANATEERSMLPFFSASGPVIKRIAAERGISLPPVEGVLPADRVADSIIRCLENPVPEVFVQAGSEEFVRALATDRSRTERHLLPVFLGERSVYEEMAKR